MSTIHNAAVLLLSLPEEEAADLMSRLHPKQVEQVKTKPKTLGWFVGQVMQATGGKANPQAVNEVLRQKLEVGED